MSTSSPDRWLLPRRQTEFPLRDLLPEEVLHARREATFLVLAMLAVLPMAVLVLAGTSHVIDLSAALASLGIESPRALALPVGAMPFVLGLIAVAIVCELFGRRRARALVVVSAVSVIVLAAFALLVDVVDGGAAFGAALALAGTCVVAEVAHVTVFDGLRRAMRGRGRFARLVIAAWIACALGFAAFAGVTLVEDGTALVPAGDAMALAAGSALWAFALTVVLAIVAAVAMRMLAVALRVGREMVVVPREVVIREVAPREVAPREVVARAPVAPAFAASVYERSARGTPAIGVDRAPRTTLQGVVKPAGSESRRLPAAQIIDEDGPEEVVALEPKDALAADPDEVVALEPAAIRRRAPRPSIQPFSSAEMQFFREGDEL